MDAEDQKLFDENQKFLAENGLKTAAKTDTAEAEKTGKETKKEEVADKDETEDETAEESKETKAEIETEESEESDEEAEDESDEDNPPLDKVPPKDFKDWKAKIKAELQADFDKKVSELGKEGKKDNPSETKTDDLEADIESLAKELNFDKEKVRKIVQTARKGLEMSTEDRKIISEFRDTKVKTEHENFIKQQEDIFKSEWEAVMPEFKKAFPNAKPEQIEKARAEMDKLSHTKKYQNTDLDYIVFKEKSVFDKILFSPKSRTFEDRQGAHEDNETDTELPTFRPDMSPAEFARFEKRRQNMIDSSPKEKIMVTQENERGVLEEVYMDSE